MSLAPFTGLGHHIFGSGQGGPGESAELLVERHVDGVEELGDLLQ
jgi:hypothetical protein